MCLRPGKSNRHLRSAQLHDVDLTADLQAFLLGFGLSGPGIAVGFKGKSKNMRDTSTMSREASTWFPPTGEEVREARAA